MGFERGFTAGLVLRLTLLLGALALLAASLLTPGLAAARIVAATGAVAAGWLVWRHVTRTARDLARFVEALALGDAQARFGRGGGFQPLAAAFDAALARVAREREGVAAELRHHQTLLDDMPVALLVVDADAQVTPGNKAARRLFARHRGTRAADYATYGDALVRQLDGRAGEGAALIALEGERPTRALVRAASLVRLGRPGRAVTVEPVGAALNAVEMAAQSDIVRVLTHEILNSLTPVRSLAATAAAMLGEIDDPRVAEARGAVATLARRAEGLGRFVESYRQVSRELVPKRRMFLARPFADELAQLFAADWPAVALSVDVVPDELAIDADPDLLAQALINLLRNAGEAASAGPAPAVALTLSPSRGEVAMAVADNGPGVPAELARDIFLPFFTTRAQGTGVGLNLVRQIAVAHGGSVALSDAPGGGAVFTLIL